MERVRQRIPEGSTAHIFLLLFVANCHGAEAQHLLLSLAQMSFQIPRSVNLNDHYHETQTH